VGRQAFAPDLALEGRKPGTTVFRWLYDEVRSAILEGRLRRGARLPSTRELAKQYRVSRGTTVAVFEQLRAEGYLESGVGGAGTSVSAHLPEDFLVAKAVRLPAGRSTRPAVLSRFAQRLSRAPGPRSQPPRPFRPLEPALEEFPMQVWAQLNSRRMRRASRRFLADDDPRGYRPLREAVAAYLGAGRGVKCTADEVVIVSGIQHALDLTVRLVVDPGDAVWVEDPCHPVLSSMFRLLGSRVVPVPVDANGLDVEKGLQSRSRARLAYVTPAHQFPLGVAMTADRRLALLDWSRRTGALIFEDDYDSEYRYTARPIPALRSLDSGGSVILAGSFSKILLPSLRLGYVVARSELAEKFAAARFFVNRHSSVINQAVMCDFITEGHFGRHLRRMRELYATRLAVLREAVDRRLRGLLELHSTEAGLNVLGSLRHGLDAEVAAGAAAEAGLEVVPLSRFVLKKPRPEALLLGFAAFDSETLRQAVDRLAAALERSASKTRRNPIDHPDNRSHG
jgi:GntR family transcriptional regulator/MocR family aminotransferase